MFARSGNNITDGVNNLLFCDKYESIVNLSAACVSESDISSFECIHNQDEARLIIRKLLGIWAVLITVFGTAGNILTLLAIPYAANHKR